MFLPSFVPASPSQADSAAADCRNKDSSQHCSTCLKKSLQRLPALSQASASAMKGLMEMPRGTHFLQHVPCLDHNRYPVLSSTTSMPHPEHSIPKCSSSSIRLGAVTSPQQLGMSQPARDQLPATAKLMRPAPPTACLLPGAA